MSIGRILQKGIRENQEKGRQLQIKIKTIEASLAEAECQLREVLAAIQALEEVDAAVKKL